MTTTSIINNSNPYEERTFLTIIPTAVNYILSSSSFNLDFVNKPNLFWKKQQEFENVNETRDFLFL